MVVAVVALLAGGTVVVVHRIDTPPPPVSVDPSLTSLTSLTAAAEPDPALPWPAMGEAAVSIPAVGYSADSGPEHPVPVASMTKVMTAYLILRDHPLALGAPGPNITITTGDADNYGTDTVSDQSSIDIDPGEVMTESQLLAGMLVHSANDFAYTLAVWDAGSLPAFVAEMNAEAATLGMTQTHYVDASGFTPGSVSTPDDLLKVTALAMDNPVFAKDVTMPSITLPVAGTISTYTPLLPGSVTGVPGVVGVKSGYTTHAGGGDILAYQSSVDGKPFVTLAAVSSQQGPNVLIASGHRRARPRPGGRERGAGHPGRGGRPAGGHRVDPRAHNRRRHLGRRLTPHVAGDQDRRARRGDPPAARRGRGADPGRRRAVHGRPAAGGGPGPHDRKASRPHAGPALILTPCWPGPRDRPPTSVRGSTPSRLAVDRYVEVEVEPASKLIVRSEGEGAGLSDDAGHLAARVAMDVSRPRPPGHDGAVPDPDRPGPRVVGRVGGRSRGGRRARATRWRWRRTSTGTRRTRRRAWWAAWWRRPRSEGPSGWPSSPSIPPSSSSWSSPTAPSLRPRPARCSPRRSTARDASFNLGRMGLLVAGLADHRLLVREATEDRLHQDYRSPLFPEAPMLLAGLLEGGALAVCWSGAGPSLLGIFDGPNGARQVAMAARHTLKETGVSRIGPRAPRRTAPGW